MTTSHSLLTTDQEASLGRRIAAGREASLDPTPFSPGEQAAHVRDGLAARDELIMHNERLVNSRVRRFMGVGRNVDDMRGDALEALVIAATRYDPSRGRFSTFAVAHVDRQIQRGLHKAGLVREGEAVAQRRRSVNRAANHLTVVGETSSDEAVADLLDISLERVQALNTPPPTVAALDGTEWAEECHADDVANRDQVASLLGLMTPKQRHVVSLLYGLDEDDPRTLTTYEVADQLNVDQSVVVRHHARGLERVRRSLSGEAA